MAGAWYAGVMKLPSKLTEPLDLGTTHQNADLDGLASMVALHLLVGPLELALPAGMDPDTKRFWSDQAAALPPIVSQPQLLRKLREAPLRRLVVADTAHASRLGPIAPYVPQFADVVAYDTHPPTADDLPRADFPQGSATVSGLVLALQAGGKEPSVVEAGLFLLAIHQDTGHFTFQSTTAVDHTAAAICCRWGAPLTWPALYVPKGFTKEQLVLLEAMAQSSETQRLGGVDVTILALELAAYEPNLAVLVEQLREAEAWPVVVGVFGSGERTFCIGRSAGAMDIGAFMRRLGGGGHGNAASAVLHHCTFAEARRQVGQHLREHLGPALVAGNHAAKPVLWLAAGATVQEASDVLHQRRINAMPLARGRGAQRRYVGVVSRQDVDAAIRHGLGARAVSEICTDPCWVAPDCPLTDVLPLLVTGAQRLVLVGEMPGAQGVLTRGLVLRATAPTFGQTRRLAPPPKEAVMAQVRRHVGPLWPALIKLAELAAGHHLPLYLVGGSVRDLFLGVAGRDVDLVVEGAASQLAQAAARALGGQVQLESDFGTAHWLTETYGTIDIASARCEYYESPAALPKIEHASLHQDLFRRDFTVNALAVGLSTTAAGEVIDPYGGFADLRGGVLRVLHGLSFHDDPTRGLRAARFAARFDFALASDTQGLLKAAVRNGVFDKLSLERIGAEIDRILSEREVVQAFRLLRDWRLLACVHPQLRAERGFLQRLGEAQEAHFRLAGTIPGLRQSEVLWLVVASNLPPDARAARSRLVPGKKHRDRWLYGPQRIHAAHAVLRGSDKRPWGRALASLDPAERVVLFAQQTKTAAQAYIVWWEQTGQHIRLAIDGNTLRAHGFKAGPLFKEALSYALDAARLGGDAAEQLAVALAVLQPSPKDA